MNSKVTIAIRCDDTKEAQLLGGSYTLDGVALSQIFFHTQNLGRAY